MASGVYAKGIGALCGGAVDWDDGGITINAQLTLSTYTPDFDTEDFRNDVESAKVSGTTDQEITGRAITYDAGNDRVHLDGPATITFTAVTGTQSCKGVALYKSLGGDSSNDPLICWNEFTALVTSNGSNIQVTFDTDGHVRFTYT